MRKIAFVAAFFVLAAGFQAAAQSLTVGSLCWAYWEANKVFYVGTVVEPDSTVKGGGYLVVFADGDVGVVPAALVRPFAVSVGTKVHAMWWKNGSFYPGTVAKVAGAAVYIHFDDGDKGWTSLAGLALPAQ